MARLPDPDEAAAIAAAVQRFEADTAVPAAGEAKAVGAWQRAALVEGVAGKATIDDLEGKGGAKWLS
jgi:hypothetical protein